MSKTSGWPPAGSLRPHTVATLREWVRLTALGMQEYKATSSTLWTLKFKALATLFELGLFKQGKARDRE